MNRVLVLHNADNDIEIASVLLALGDPVIGTCNTQLAPIKVAIDSLRFAGIATVVASGNGGSNSVNGPACISTAVSVGASTDGDEKWEKTNEDSGLDLYAPGVFIITSDTGNKMTAARSGTSLAAAHVAGAWAVLKKDAPHATVDKIRTVLRDTGEAVTGATSSATRINLEAATSIEIPEIDDSIFFIIKSKNGKIAVISL